ncbi:MAG: DUF11 domain-containing protein [Acidobacteria bacterium]|nr:DUF11 domain-containing protein [Acidobacteriota bacterium]
MKKIFLLSLLLALMTPTWAQTAAGTIISNVARATYTDPSTGETGNAVSNTVTVTVLPVGGVAVSPDETTVSSYAGPREVIVRSFLVCNTGNSNNQYVISNQTITPPSVIKNLYFDIDNDGKIGAGDSKITLSSTTFPSLAPGACVTVLAEVDTGAVAPQTEINVGITATGTATYPNGNSSDKGNILIGTLKGPEITNPKNPALPPFKGISTNKTDALNSTDKATVIPGQPYWITLAFKNTGGSAGLNVILKDDLPTGTSYVAGTLFIDGVPQTDAADTDPGQAIPTQVMAAFPSIALNQVVTLQFQIMIDQTLPGVGIINTFTVMGSNFDPVTSNPVKMTVNPVGIVYAGRSLGTIPVGGATVILSSDAAAKTPITLPADVGLAPNQPNKSTHVTPSSGGFNFTFDPSQLGTGNLPAKFYISVTSPSYVARLIEVTTTPTANGLFDITLKAADGQPLALPGSFVTTQNVVTLKDMSLLVFNIPLYELVTLDIRKTNDRNTAVIGDTVSYRLDVRNTTAINASNVIINDTLPRSFSYIDATATIERNKQLTPITPVVIGNKLTFNLGTLISQEAVSIIYRVRIGTGAAPGEHTNVAVAEGSFPNGDKVTTGGARSTVFVSLGVFDDSQIIIGRVFEDLNGNGYFDEGEDRPVSSARIYTSNGRSVLTDTAGLYNFPLIDVGNMGLTLDPQTLPPGDVLLDEGLNYQHSWTRLVRPLLGGGLYRVNFPLQPKDWKRPEITLDPEKRQPCDTSEPLTEKERKDKKLHEAADQQAGRENPLDQGLLAKQTLPAPKAGEIQVTNYKNGEVIKGAALDLRLRTSLDYKLELSVNDTPISDKQIGTTRRDTSTKSVEYTYNAIPVQPGANQVQVKAVGPNGEEGQIIAVTLYKGGQAGQIVVTPVSQSVRAGGRDSIVVGVQVLDAKGLPAQDTDIRIKASAGTLVGIGETLTTRALHTLNGALNGEAGSNATGASNPVSQNEFQLHTENGIAELRFFSPSKAGVVTLLASTGDINSLPLDVRVTPDIRPTIMVSNATVSVGKASPENAFMRTDEQVQGRGQVFIKAPVLSDKTMVTFSYDSARPLNRFANQNSLFDLDNSLRRYDTFGDTSQSQNETLSNSKIYALLERNTSYGMFGDFTLSGRENGNYLNRTQLQPSLSLSNSNSLAEYNRRLTGGKIHLEDSGSFITAIGARPDTAFARDVFAGGSTGYGVLSNRDILLGSEQIFVEVRDRRNPEVILKREGLQRNIDYNIDYTMGTIYFLRPINPFTYNLNLVQIIATYEHREGGLRNSVYGGAAQYKWGRAGFEVGGSYVDQKQGAANTWTVGGLHVRKSLGSGFLSVEGARTSGELMNAGNFFFNGSGASGSQTGDAYRAELNLPFHRYNSKFQGVCLKSDQGFYNPFGGTVTPGNQRTTLQYSMDPVKGGTLRIEGIDERNHTANVNNNRRTFGASYSQQITPWLKLTGGYDYRDLNNNGSSTVTAVNPGFGTGLGTVTAPSTNTFTVATGQTVSQMVTVGAEIKPMERLEINLQREQNLSSSHDQSFPNQTTLGASWEINKFAKLVINNRMGSAPIIPTADVSSNGFAVTAGRHELSMGIESKLPWAGIGLNGRYQIENGVSSTDSYMVLGVNDQLSLRKSLSLDFGVEQGFHIAGQQGSFTSGILGLSYAPEGHDFKASSRYELRDRNGFGHIFSLGATGKLSDSLTLMGQIRESLLNLKMPQGQNKGENNGQNQLTGRVSLAWRPLESDRTAMLFSYDIRRYERDIPSTSALNFTLKSENIQQISSDGLVNLTQKVELYGRFAWRHSQSVGLNLIGTSTDTYLYQARLQNRFARYFDFTLEGRGFGQFGLGGTRYSYGAEIGYWPISDIRLAVGYNARKVDDFYSFFGQTRKGTYFSISTKTSRFFNLFGTDPVK